MTRETLRRAVLPAAVFVACAFLLLPHALIGQRTYAAVDLTETWSPNEDALTGPPHVESIVQTDQAETMAGRKSFFQALRRGTFQLWDPNLAAGEPTGTLPLGAFFSPFSVGFLVLPAWYAIGLRVFLALVFSQAFTYLLLRRLGTAVGPAVLAGVAYTFSGTNLVFIHRVDVVFVVPALFWAVHRLAARPGLRSVAVLAGLVAWGWFEGFPSGWVYCLYAAAAWAAWLAVRGSSSLRAAVGRVLPAAAAMVWGVALAAVTLVPFVSEVLDRGTLAVRAGATGGHIPSIELFGLFDLSAIGPPLSGPWWSGLNPVEGISHVGMIVAAGVAAALVLAALGRVRLTREGAAAWPFFCGMAVVGLVVNFFGTPLLTVAEHLPGIAQNPISRSRFLLTLAVVVLAALAVDALWARRGEAAGVQASRAASAVALAVLGGAVLVEAPAFARAASRANLLRYVSVHFALAAAVAVVAVGVAILAVRRPSARVQVGATLALSALLFGQLGWPLRHFTPEAPISDFYGERPGDAALRQLLGGRYRFTASEYTFYPNSGQALGLADLRGQTLHSKQFKALVTAFNPQAFSRDPLKILLKREQWNLTSPLLDDLGVRFFAEGTNELPFGRVADGADLTWDRWMSAGTAGDTVTAGVAPGPLNGMYVPLRVRGQCRGAWVQLTLRSGDRAIASSQRPAFEVNGGWTGFALLGRALAAGDPYGFTATSTTPACQVDLGMTGARAARQLLVEDPGQAVRLVSTEQSWIYERPSAWELVSAHPRWRAFPDQASLLAWAATRPPADADVAAYVAPAGRSPAPPAAGAPEPEPAPVVTSSISDNSVHADVTGAAESLLVVSENLASGWTAEVDGKPAPLVAVDGALMGVFVPAGHHRVRLAYRPKTFLAGSAVTAVALMGLAVAVVLPAWRRRRLRPSR